MNREYFTKPFYEDTAPPSAQEGYEQSMFTSHPQPFESSDVSIIWRNCLQPNFFLPEARSIHMADVSYTRPE
jgi:hypothetical protein